MNYEFRYLEDLVGFDRKAGNSWLFNADYKDVFPNITPGSVDMIFADLPYNKTQSRFDKSVIKMEGNDGLWEQYKQLLRPNGNILLTASQPFTSYLVSTAYQHGLVLNQEWIWEKTQATGHLNSKSRPMQAHESVLVFVKKGYKGHTYNPQMTSGHPRKVSLARHKHNTANNQSECYGKSDRFSDYDSTVRFPRSVVRFASDKQKSALHPNQKPIALLEYFLKTYSNEGDIVLDNVAGSLSTAEACNNVNRYCIAIEADSEYFNKGATRFKQ